MIPGSGLQIALFIPTGILARCCRMCVTNSNQAKLVALVFGFAEQNEVSTFGQNNPIIRCQYSKIIFSAKIKAS